MRPRFLLLTLFCFLAGARAAHAQDRGGFTLLATMGYGIQSNGVVEVGDNYRDDVRSYGGGTYSALAGINLGIGGFVASNTALMLRFSGTEFTGEYIDQNRSANETKIGSAVAVLDVQYWFKGRFNLEAGAGLGVLTTEVHDESGLGLLLAGGYSFLEHGKLSLQIGIEDALVIDHKRTVNNLGFCFGIQLL